VDLPAVLAGEPAQVVHRAGLAGGDVHLAARARQPVPLAREPHEREGLVAAQGCEVEDEVAAAVVQQGPDGVLERGQLDVPQVRADVDHGRALAEPPHGRLDRDRRGQQVGRQGAHRDTGCPPHRRG
jgi:hypothetical protein